MPLGALNAAHAHNNTIVLIAMSYMYKLLCNPEGFLEMGKIYSNSKIFQDHDK